MKRECSYCGLETWQCGCGGHCFDRKEYNEWVRLYGNPKEKRICAFCGKMDLLNVILDKKDKKCYEHPNCQTVKNLFKDLRKVGL